MLRSQTASDPASEGDQEKEAQQIGEMLRKDVKVGVDKLYKAAVPWSPFPLSNARLCMLLFLCAPSLLPEKERAENTYLA